MQVEHTITVIAVCPANKFRDEYQVTFRLNRFERVERIIELADDYMDSEIYQEQMTQDMADHMQCEVESVGVHCNNVRTRVVCIPAKRKPSKK